MRGRHAEAQQAEVRGVVMPQYFLVFTAKKFKNVMGAQGLTWEIAGVYQADNAQRACLKGMQATGHGTAFAIDGFAFGVDMEDVSDVGELGKPQDPIERLTRMGEELTQRLTALTAPTTHELTPGDDDGNG